MSGKRDDILAALWRGRDPFAQFPRHLFQVDTQGWGAQHHYLAEFFEDRPSPVVVEIGVWKGASTLMMANRMREAGSEGVVVAVDTWLGAEDHWTNDEWFEHLAWDHGFPSISRKFMANVVDAGLENYVVPLPLDSINAAMVFRHFGLTADVIHLDAGHTYESVLSDLRAWWPVLREGGLLIGDDYYEEVHWPGVKQAFDEFFAPLGFLPLENVSGKCRLTKSLSVASA